MSAVMPKIERPEGFWASVAWLIRGKRAAPETRWKATTVINWVSAGIIAGTVGMHWLNTEWRLGLTFAELRCLEGTAFLIDVEREVAAERGDMLAYRARGLMPIAPDGQVVVKLVAAVPGDRVRVDASGIYINDVKWGELNPITMERTGWTVQRVTREFVVGEGELLMLGDQPRSYDGRYWGPIRINQLEGKAWRLW